MKILALIDLAPGVSLDAARAEVPAEVKASWGLFAAGVLREAYATSAPKRVVFVLEAGSVAQAAESLRALPMVAGGLVRCELLELRPFVNWSVLFGQ